MCKKQCKQLCSLKGQNGADITTAPHLCPAMQKKLERAAQFVDTQQQPIIIEPNGVSTISLIIQ